MTLEDILQAVSEVAGVPVRAMEGVTKKQEVADARHLFIQVSRDYEFKVMDIGAAINKSHSSVCCSKRRDEESIKKVKSILSGEVAPVEVEEKNIRDTDFEIVDISSKYFGSCFMILREENPVSFKDNPVDAIDEVNKLKKMEARKDE